MDDLRMHAEPHITVVFPCYNEERRLPSSLTTVQDYLRTRKLSYEILVVDDGSQDGTARVVQAAAAADPSVFLIRCTENQGKGSASAYGALRATGEWILFSDADLSTPVEELERLVPHLSGGYDVVIGSRALPESDLTVRQQWWREWVGRRLNVAIRRAARLRFRDTQCGFKLYTRRAARDIFGRLTVKRWLFDAEALLLAEKLGYRVQEVPVTWRNSSESRVKLRHGWSILSELSQLWRSRRQLEAGAEGSLGRTRELPTEADRIRGRSELAATGIEDEAAPEGVG